MSDEFNLGLCIGALIGILAAVIQMGVWVYIAINGRKEKLW